MADFTNNFSNLMNKSLKGPIGSHLRNVYACVASSAILSAIGAWIHMSGIWQGGILSILGSIGFLLILAFSHFWILDPSDISTGDRFLCLNAFALCNGVSTGPLIEAVWFLDPSIVISALLYTCVIFTCFSIIALISPNGKYLALGGPLMSILSTMLLYSVLNVLFIHSASLAYFHVLLGLCVMSAFILYDTHLIIEKFRVGDHDFIWHSVVLFVDVASIFKHILVLLAVKDRDRRR